MINGLVVAGFLLDSLADASHRYGKWRCNQTHSKNRGEHLLNMHLVRHTSQPF